MIKNAKSSTLESCRGSELQTISSKSLEREGTISLFHTSRFGLCPARTFNYLIALASLAKCWHFVFLNMFKKVFIYNNLMEGINNEY